MSVRCLVFTILPPFARHYAQRLEGSPLGYQLSRGIFWSLAGALISRGLTLLSSILVVRMLGKEAFGALGIVQSTVGMFGIFAGFGLGLTATKHIAEFRYSDPARAGRIIALTQVIAVISGVVFTLALIVGAPWLAAHTLASPNLTTVLQVGAGLIFWGALNGVLTGALSGFQAFKTIAQINLIAGLCSFPCLLCGARYGGLMGAVWGLNAGLAINWLLSSLALSRLTRESQVSVAYAGCKREWRIVSSFSILAVLGGAMVGPTNWLCNSLLVNQPHGYAEMGVFSAANQWRIAILFLPAMIGDVALPLMSNLFGTGDSMGYRKVLRFSALINGVVALLVALPLIIFARVLLSGYGTGFQHGHGVFVVLILSAIIIAVNNTLSRAIASTGHMWAEFSVHLAWGACYVLCGFLLIPRYAAMGMAVAALISAGFEALCAGGIVLWRLDREGTACRQRL